MPRARKYARYQPGLIYLFDLTGDRVKIGFTAEATPATRLSAAKCWVPEAEELAHWPAMKTWENLVWYHVVGKLDMKPIGNSEVFIGVANKLEVKQELDRFFAMLPELEVIDQKAGEQRDEEYRTRDNRLSVVSS